MKVIIDTNAGVCAGVKRALKITDDFLQNNDELTALGEVIHNRKELQRLSCKGLETVAQERVNNGELTLVRNKNVLVRAHGISAELSVKLNDAAATVIDTTCPVVKRLQKLVHDRYAKGLQIIILGKQEHPEVMGLLGHCQNKGIVIKDENDFDLIDCQKKSILLCQTTVSKSSFSSVSEKLLSLVKDLEIHDSTCNQVNKRHDLIRAFAKDVDVLLVVGGRNSSNTHVLYNIGKKVNRNCHYIESADDVDLTWFTGNDTIGITGGASTPIWQLEKVKDDIEGIAQLG